MCAVRYTEFTSGPANNTKRNENTQNVIILDHMPPSVKNSPPSVNTTLFSPSRRSHSILF